MFTTKTTQRIIGKDGCSSGADEILSGTFISPPNLLTPLQEQYFKHLQWKNRIQPKGVQEKFKMKDIKEGFNKLKD